MKQGERSLKAYQYLIFIKMGDSQVLAFTLTMPNSKKESGKRLVQEVIDSIDLLGVK